MTQRYWLTVTYDWTKSKEPNPLPDLPRKRLHSHSMNLHDQPTYSMTYLFRTQEKRDRFERDVLALPNSSRINLQFNH